MRSEVSKERLLTFSKMCILNHEDEIAAINDRIDFKLLKRFQAGDEKKREVIAALMNNRDILFAEMREIIAESVQANINE
tara:strand:+ start:252 stop:491 length:240 start_codon:yes stop_codon:yes gene_type:complete